MVRYPHTVSISWKSEGTNDEDSGDYAEGSDNSHTVSCSVSGNRSGKKIGSDDGKLIEYSKSLIMPQQLWIAPFGAEVILVMENGLSTNETVKLMHNFQTYSQIWL